MNEKQRKELIKSLQFRFEKTMKGHTGVEWLKVQAKLEANAAKLESLNEMERTGGEPDVVEYDKKTGEYVFYDCSPESPKGRRSICYDGEALESRKEHKPRNNALDMAAAMGIEILTEEQYRSLQKLGQFDAKTSSWLKRLLKSESSVVRSLPIFVTRMSSYITTVRSPIMLPGAFEAR